MKSSILPPISTASKKDQCAAEHRKTLKGKVRNLELNNLLYGYGHYTDNAVLKEMVGLPPVSPTEKPDTFSSARHGGKEDDREMALLITMTSKELPHSETKNADIVGNRMSPQGVSELSRKHLPVVHPRPSKLANQIWDNLDTAPDRLNSGSSVFQREPSYTHVAPIAPRVPFIREPRTSMYESSRAHQHRLADVLPPIVFYSSTSGRLFEARSSSTKDEKTNNLSQQKIDGFRQNRNIYQHSAFETDV